MKINKRAMMASVGVLSFLLMSMTYGFDWLSTEKIVDDWGISMVLIPAGSFDMGENVDVAVDECEKLKGKKDHVCKNIGNGSQPIHSVYLDAYYIDEFEVTNESYLECIEEGVCSAPDMQLWENGGFTTYYGLSVYGRYDDPIYSKHPITIASDDLSWNDAVTYCNWRDARLPTEAEWEKAARGTSGLRYPWGDTFIGEYANTCDANCPMNSFFDHFKPDYDDGVIFTAPVGSFPMDVSPYGVYDMAGNVSEYVADYFNHEYYQFSPTKNPLGPEYGFGENEGTYHSIRGANWDSYEIDVALYRRGVYYYQHPETNHLSIGFRCVRSK